PHGMELIADLGYHAGELGTSEQDARAGVVDDPRDLLWRQPAVHNRVDGSGQAAGKRGLQARWIVLVQEGDPVTGQQAETRLRAGRPPDAIGPLPPRPGPLAVANGDPLGCRGFPVADVVEDVARGWQLGGGHGALQFVCWNH